MFNRSVKVMYLFQNKDNNLKISFFKKQYDRSTKMDSTVYNIVTNVPSKIRPLQRCEIPSKG